jgi:ferredoxin/DNA-binding Lrp family transcriptional regulator
MTEAKLKAEIDYYDVVRQKLAVGPLNYPRHEKIFELMKVFWPDEEIIKLLTFFPPTGEKISLAELAEKSGMSTSEVRKILKKPVKNKTISQVGKEYGLEPLVPGIFEAYFIARQDTPENLKKAGEIYRWLFKNQLEPPMINKDFELFRPLLPITTKEKLIKIDETVESDSIVLPYELVEDLINKNEFFAVIPCQCRLVGELSGEPCERAPSEMGCFITGTAAQAIASFGYGKALSKTEAIQYLKDTEKAGLVHSTSNSIGGEHLMFICNCCPCHCGALKPTKDYKYKIITHSNFEPIIDPKLCAECETCLKKCPMDAISHPDKEKMVINSELCIGCGLCATNCPKNAITLKKVRDLVPPKTKKIGNKMFMQMLGELLA